MPTVDPPVVEAFKKVKKDTSMDFNTLSIKLDATGEVCSDNNLCCCFLYTQFQYRLLKLTSSIRTCAPSNLQKSCLRLLLDFLSFHSNSLSPMGAYSTR